MTKEQKVEEHVIPKDSFAMANLWGFMKDPDVWPEAEMFRPERFLDEAGSVRKGERLIPFGIGKRQCLGETLARTELFLFFTALVHAFNFLPEVEGEPPAEEWQLGITSLPKPFKLRMKPRF